MLGADLMKKALSEGVVEKKAMSNVLQRVLPWYQERLRKMQDTYPDTVASVNRYDDDNCLVCAPDTHAGCGGDCVGVCTEHRQEVEDALSIRGW